MKGLLAVMCILAAAYVEDEHQSVMFVVIGMTFALMGYVDRAVAIIKEGQK